MIKTLLDPALTPSPVQLVKTFDTSNISLYVKREDLLHPEVSGNKFRKLKHNLLAARGQNKDTLLTFGGAFSNHIAAVAAAGKLFGFKTIGIIRGEELAEDLSKTFLQNPTLKYATSRDMELKFISRDNYREKDTPLFIEGLLGEFGDFYLLPEGGTNSLAIKGCEEILDEKSTGFDFICCAVGTGGTISGIINSSLPHQKIIGFPALKGNFLKDEILKYTSRKNWNLQKEYHFGGYGKINSALIDFINDFQKKYHIPLDPVYTGKMFFGIFDLIQSSAFPQNSRILAIHTGGLQGNAGMNRLLMKKGLPQIDIL
ncbi:1-aminocyclopropane-1-carboxylate deaminase/D-cysteine desulfhydrase [Antarcticibacterium arcticum]|uniref:1-aminocyclopropane-1-carboxylate deaminase/D-cysteine desulfhydrase n=1 Tax=Antarcticibacterium arcticum TaxID=2585771 RepID=A0A5B8YL86_9FLAO|nr:pyridoxal-phosphate dependent enzyme [Antarcticibacterium arcticum]QED37567.1 1-aminocyclopropane-1-carboxylate deaminase/D-cysteine desulfhydrase [Antarcticibacterium arcticum]